MASIRDRVSAAMYSAISTTIGVRAESLTDGTQPIADLGVKSVNFVRIISALEDEFGLEIPFMEFRRKKTIGEAIDFVVDLHES